MGCININDIKRLIDDGQIDQAIALLDDALANGLPTDELYYYRGNAYRAKSQWQRAACDYMEAVAINPNSPAQEALTILDEIFNFFNKDLWNH